MAENYNHKDIEKKWQDKWEADGIYNVPNQITGKENFYQLVEFSYPSGNLHVGHWYAFSVPDIFARYKRMQGFNVLYPMGFDAFGLPAENAAIKLGADPKVWTIEQMEKMRIQLRTMGAMFPWDREVVTCDPEYYRWTQWMFNQFLKNDLVYRAITKVNWCPKDQTILANEQVTDGKCERCGTEVIQRDQPQWMLRITKYADRLIDDLDALAWPENIKDSQKNWIGRSEGSEIDFKINKKYKYVLLHGFQGSPNEGKYLWLKKELEKSGHEVIAPVLPNTNFPKEEEQVAAALEATEYDENTILYGHSLGSVVAMKVLEKLKSPIAGTVLSGAFCGPDVVEDVDFKDTFNWEFDVKKIKDNSGFIKIIQDTHDDAVSKEQMDEIERLLGVNAKKVKAQLPHFDATEEPELLNILEQSIKVFTTRADTLFGVTYVVLAPEHPLIESLKPQVKNNKVVESFKFRPELVELIKRGEKNVTFRMESKNLLIGDTVSLIDWADGNKENQAEFLQAKITKISEFKLIDLPLDYPGHEKDSSVEERLIRYQEYYGKDITNESTVYVYEFAPIYSKILNFGEVEKYIADSKKKSELDRQQSKEKTGVELKGIKAINPANGEEVPVWIADYVLAGYGTGAVMAVPAHDERDFEFAKKYNLPIKKVIEPIVVDTTGDSAVKEGELFTKRSNVAVVLRNPKDDTYLCTNWKDHHMYGLVTGGIDQGEDIVTTAIREIQEETGYKNIRFISDPGFAVQTKFFHRVKKQNRWARYQVLFFELIDEERDAIDEAEAQVHELVWKTKDELNHYFTVAEGEFAVKLIQNPNFIYTEDGILFNSGEFTDLQSTEARKKITEFVGGKIVKTYRLRDWGISRQRYWGCPIPIVYDPEGNAHPVPDEHLPWILPTDVDHTPDGTAPLARSKELFERTEKIFGEGWRPEVETMDTFVDSSWYFYRYLDNKNEKEFSSMDKMDAWMPIDLYMGGAEHTTMHLLYSRFWTKALYDIGFVKDNEAYKVRRNRGLILGPDGEKMSKSRGNVINPDEIVERLGADTVRLYLAFMGPYGNTANYPWDPNGVVGVRRFIERVYKLKEKISDNADDTGTLLHKVIKKITEDIEEFKFNTAISQMMILINDLDKKDSISKDDYKILLKLLAPFAPHIAEELWNEMGESSSIHLTDWPKWDDSKIVDNENLIIIQVNGKVRAEITMPSGISEDEAVSVAKDNEKVKNWISDKDIKRVIYVPGRIINFVI